MISSEMGGIEPFKCTYKLHNTRNLIYKLYAALYVRSVAGLRGGPCDTWGGGYGFSFGIKLFFSTPSLNVQFFSDLIKSKHFFSER